MSLWSTFFSTGLLGFAFALLAGGLFGAYYGKGRSRSIGFLLAITALLVAGLFSALTWDLVPGIDPIFNPSQVLEATVAAIAAAVGAVLAVLLFVSAVTRS